MKKICSGKIEFRIIILCLVLIFSVTEIISKPNIQQNDEVAKRPKTKVTLKLDKGKVNVEFPSVAYVMEDGSISIIPGETFFIEFDIVNETLVRPKYSKNNRDSSKTLKLSMLQSKDGTILIIDNGFSKPIIADCFVQYYGTNKLIKSNILPVLPRMGSAEGWDNRVCFILLRNIRFQEYY